LASGLLTIKLAIIISIIFSIISLTYFFFFTQEIVFLLVTSYLIINFLYSFYFKKLRYLDLIIVLLGFLIRIYLGSISTEIIISTFLVMQVIFFVLFIIICKRREYFFSFEKNVFSKYSITELNFLSKFFLIINLINYIIYIFNNNTFIGSSVLFVSFILYAILLIRYFFITFRNKVFDPIIIYLNDKYLIMLSLLYLINFVLGFYGVY